MDLPTIPSGSLEELIDRLRPRDAPSPPPPEPEPPPGPPAPEAPAPAPAPPTRRRGEGPVLLAVAVLVTTVGIWGMTDVGRRIDDEHAAAIGETTRPPVGATDPSSASTATTRAPSATATTAPAPAETPAAVEATSPPATTATTTPPTTRPPAPTTTTTPTTAPPPPPIQPIAPATSSVVVGSVRLTLTATPPPSGAIRTAGFELVAEFGDARVARSIRLDFGDGTATDGSVPQWACLDPAAPNPYVFAGPTHEYAAPGTYVVTATLGTAPCDPTDPGRELAGETSEIRLSLAVP